MKGCEESVQVTAVKRWKRRKVRRQRKTILCALKDNLHFTFHF